MTEHGDDTFDEINLVYPGMNGGWVQAIGPISRIGEFKSIETSFFLPPEPFPSLQQWRWPPSLIANNAAQAQSRMFMMPGAFYVDPQFSWRWATLPGALGFAPPQFWKRCGGQLARRDCRQSHGRRRLSGRFPGPSESREFGVRDC
jgi:hypothetical protein